MISWSATFLHWTKAAIAFRKDDAAKILQQAENHGLIQSQCHMGVSPAARVQRLPAGCGGSLRFLSCLLSLLSTAL